ncbi:hypothetical protein ACFSTE_18810 [Aquimarina hainanensis]|uniref:DUF3052 domain-containing protein n=1 Tax=Aquimarina hainanensis TaxID=1578017 RepID=A0ABW5NCS5_9FLAO
MEASKIFKKLLVHKANRLLIYNAPDHYEAICHGISFDRQFTNAEKNVYDFIQIFAQKQEELEAILPQIIPYATYDGLFWICYPKGTGNIKSNINRSTTWEAFSLINYKPVTQVAIDQTWTAMRGRPVDRVGK